MRNINKMLLSASLLVWLAAVFMTTSSVRGTRLMRNVDCTRAYRDLGYFGRCRNPALDGCTITNISDCTRRLQCDQDMHRRWTDSHACDVRCWVYTQPFQWFGQYEYPVAANMTTINFNGHQVHREMASNINLATYVTDIQHFVKELDLSQLGSLRIDVTDRNCPHHGESSQGFPYLRR